MGDLYVRKTAHYYNLFKTGQRFEEYVPNWVPLEDFKPTVANVAYQDLGLSNEFENDALLRRSLRHAQDWIVQYTGRSFKDTEHNVLGWLDKSWIKTREARSTVGVAAYRDVRPGTVVQIGDGTGFEPIEFAQIKEISRDRDGVIWELAFPLQHDRRDGEPIFEVVAGELANTRGLPAAIRLANIQLANAILDYLVENTQTTVEKVPASVFTQEMKDKLKPFRSPSVFSSDITPKWEQEIPKS